MSYRNERDPLRGRTMEQFHQEMDFSHAIKVARATGRRPHFRNKPMGLEAVLRSSGQDLSKK